MDAAKQLFHKHLFSSMLILLAFLISNTILLMGILLLLNNDSNDLALPISQISEHIKVDSQWNVTADDEVTSLLYKHSTWAMVLDNHGTVIWENFMPKQLPRQYTAPEIAKFSRWYLDGYPVLVEALSAGLLVIGYPPNSITKLNYVTNNSSVSIIIYSGAFVVMVNVLFVLLFFWHNTHKIEKAVIPILHGIVSIAKGKHVTLSEKRELAEISRELNRAGQQLIKRDSARADWINGVSHDVRTPLSIILGYAGEIEDSQTLPKTTRDKAGIIRKQGEKLRQLITDLNLTSRLKYSMQPINIGTFYPIELTRQVISDFLNNGLDQKYQIDFDADPDLDAAAMQGDRSLISRMLGNLIQNSISHNPDGCHIIVAVHKTPQGFQYSVTDNGSGLSDKQLEQFNAGAFSGPDYEANGETAHGFGLRLVHQIVKAHEGSMAYENSPAYENGPACGLSIKIFFPV